MDTTQSYNSEQWKYIEKSTHLIKHSFGDDTDSEWCSSVQMPETAFDVQSAPCVSREAHVKIVRLVAAAPDLLAAHDPDMLEAIADELFGTFQNSARADSLRVLARKARAAIAKATT